MATGPRKIFRNRGGVITTTIAIIAAGTAITGGIVSGTFDNPDASGPSLFLTAPAAGATVSGSSVTVSATCGDNVGCVGVQFQLNNANLGAEDTSAPFSVTWDASASGNGTYTIAAIARDAAGHTKTATSETVTVSGGAGGGPPVANEWVNLSAGASPSRCSTACAYDSTHAYATIQTAYNSAQPGDTISVKCGTYAGFTWTDNGNQGSSTLPVLVEPATLSGGCLAFSSGLTITTAKYIDLYGGTSCAQNFPSATSCGITVANGNTTDILFLDANHDTVDGAQFAAFDMEGGGNDTVKNSDSTTCNIVVNNAVCSNRLYPNGPADVPTGDVIDHNLFHDLSTSNANFGHVECLFLRGSSNATVTNNRFWHCDVFDIFVQTNGGTNNSGATIQQNWFAAPCTGLNDACGSFGTTALNFSDQSPGSSVKVSFNSGCATCSYNTAALTDSSDIFAANLGQKDAGCATSSIYSYWFAVAFSNNPPYNQSCGTSFSLVSSFDYTTAATDSTFNYKLTGNGVAEANSVPTSVAGGCPATDSLGAARPKSGNANCSAGATEP